ncbi:MAG TPA: hypothetical protein VED40_08905 [Azospirillaceae bacterium]|nr:hypothetical protein [Azospirillaceae bacterium]
MAPGTTSITDHQRREIDAALGECAAKLERLRTLDPYLLDLSLREPTVGAPVGHTLQNKLEIWQMVRAFGFRDMLIASLDYPLPEHHEVEDDFVQALRESGQSLDGCFAFTTPGETTPRGFEPHPSMVKLRDYGIPNTLHEIYLADLKAHERHALIENLGASIAWLHKHVKGDAGGEPRIYVNIVDMPDAMVQDPEWVVGMVSWMAAQPIAAVSFEDGRGTYFPFQVGAYARILRTLLPAQVKVLLHVHAGNGMENASVVEALLNGADGVWGGMTKEAATIGHASLSELIVNLMRAGNKAVEHRYKLKTMMPLVRAMQTINTEQETPADSPIFGTDAYRMMLSMFEQKKDRPMDVPPEAIGTSYGYRIAPVSSDVPVIQGRVREALGVQDLSEATARRMIELMRLDMRAGKRIRYDDPRHLAELLARAQAKEPVVG